MQIIFHIVRGNLFLDLLQTSLVKAKDGKGEGHNKNNLKLIHEIHM